MMINQNRGLWWPGLGNTARSGLVMRQFYGRLALAGARVAMCSPHRAGS